MPSAKVSLAQGLAVGQPLVLLTRVSSGTSLSLNGTLDGDTNVPKRCLESSESGTHLRRLGSGSGKLKKKKKKLLFAI